MLPTYKQYGWKLGTHIALKLAVIAAVLYVAGAVYFIRDKAQQVDSVIEGQLSQIEYWYQVGDGFQLERFFAGLSQHFAVRKVEITLLSDQNRSSTYKYLSDQLTNRVWEYKRQIRIPIHVVGDAGTLELTHYISLWPAIIAATILLSLIAYSALYLNKALNGLTNELVEPIEELVKKIEGLETTSGLTSLSLDSAEFFELDALVTNLSGLAKRLENSEAERVLLEKHALLVDISRRVAHDIRSPLSALQIVSQKASELDLDQRQLMQKAIDQIKRIAADLLDQSRALSRPSGMPLKEILQWIVALKSAEIEPSKKIQIILDCENDLVLSVDETEFSRIVSNLLNNSIEAMDKPGSVVISCKKSGQRLNITISDTGKGIPPKVLPLLGKANVSLGKNEGNGLGVLSACEKIRSWGGEVVFHSVLNKGTEVTISIPNLAQNSLALSL